MERWETCFFIIFTLTINENSGLWVGQVQIPYIINKKERKSMAAVCLHWLWNHVLFFTFHTFDSGINMYYAVLRHMDFSFHWISLAFKGLAFVSHALAIFL